MTAPANLLRRVLGPTGRRRARSGLGVARRTMTAATARARTLMSPPIAVATVEDVPTPAAPCGLVESLNGKEIIGWVHVDEHSVPVRVGLYLGDLEVDHVEPAARVNRTTVGDVRGFRFRLKDIWKYCGPHDQISVRLDGERLPMSGRGMYYPPRNQGELPQTELESKLADGWVFASNGRLNKSKADDLEWQDTVLGLYDRVRIALKEITGYEGFFIYGSLLGAVREGDFLGHDFDFDAAYLSRHRDATQAGAELGEIGMALIERGFQVESRSICLHIHDSVTGREKIDLFHLYFDNAGKLQFPWGVAGTRAFRIDQWEGLEQIPFARATGTVPRNADALVETMYGANWRIPNPGFDWARDRTEKATGANIPPKVGSWINWQDYWLQHQFEHPSTFQQSIMTISALPSVVFDLGCGDGRDSMAFAAAGHQVLGLDWSASGVESAHRRAQSLPEEMRPRFVICDLDDRAQVVDLLTADRGDEPALFYGRFLLHALFDDTTVTLLSVLDEVSRQGDILALEFRGLEDEALPKHHHLAYRRYLDGSAVQVMLTQMGYTTIDSQSGTSLAPLEKEDPFVHRVVAHRTTAGANTPIAGLTTRIADTVREVTGASPHSGPGGSASRSLSFESAAADAANASEEIKAIAFALIDNGVSVEATGTTLVVSSNDGSVTVTPMWSADEVTLEPATIEEIYWASFYAHTEYTHGSSFFDAVVRAAGVPDRVIDLGCGDGRDSYAFASTGRSVLGIDRSHIGVSHAGRKAQELEHDEAARFVACDVSQADRLREVLTAEVDLSLDRPILFYARFFLHSIPEDVQSTLMSAIDAVARSGDWFVAEFRTDQDATTQKVHQHHYRRFQNGPAFARLLTDQYRFTVVETQQGRGLSPYRGEDPHLFRVMARRD